MTCRTPSSQLILPLGLILILGCGGSDEAEPEPRAGEVAATSRIPPSDPRLSDLDFLRRQRPSADVDIAIGNVFFQREELDSALARYQSATRRDPEDLKAWNLVGITLGHLDRLDEAETAYRKAIDIDAFYAKTHINLGNVYLRRSKLKEAIREYKLATSIDSTDAQAWLNLGLAYDQDGMVNPSILAYNKAIECAPDDPEPWERLGWIYYNRKLYKAARERWTEAVSRDPSRADLREHIRTLEAWAETTGTR